MVIIMSEMIKWKKESGQEVETNDCIETIKMAESLGWTREAIEEKAPAKKVPAKKAPAKKVTSE